MNSLQVNLQGAVPAARYGYSDGKDVGGEKYVGRWVRYGRNLAEGKSYTVSVPSGTQWGAGDPNGTKLTDGVVGPNYAGGIGPGFGLCWDKGTNPIVTVDLGAVQRCGAFRIHLSAGWPWWDAMKGEVKDTVEVLTSTDAQAVHQPGLLRSEPATQGHPDQPHAARRRDGDRLSLRLVAAGAGGGPLRAVQITPQRILTVSEVQVLDSIRYEPFDLRIALPDEKE